MKYAKINIFVLFVFFSFSVNGLNKSILIFSRNNLFNRPFAKYFKPKTALKSSYYNPFFHTINSSLNIPSVEILFPDRLPLRSYLIDLINNEKKSILFAMYALNHIGVIDALLKAKERNVSVVGVVDKNTVDNIREDFFNQRNSKNNALIRDFIKTKDIGIYACYRRSMHNKIWCFAKNGSSNSFVSVLGSANCTMSGLDGTCDRENNLKHTKNADNLIIVKDSRKIYNKCELEINYLLRIANEMKKERELRDVKYKNDKNK